MTNIARMVRFQPVHLVVLALILIVFTIGATASDRFASMANMSNIQDQMVALALVALAQTFVILSGGIDLSFAGMLGFLAVVFASLAGGDPDSFALAVTVTLSLGLVLGAVNGGITAFVGIHPLIVTLGTSTILAGLALLITRQPSGSVPLFFEDLVYGRMGPIPYGTMFVIALYILAGFMLWKTRFGTRIFAVGDNENAASLSGVPVKQTKVMVYALSGFLVAVTAIYICGRFGVGDPRAGVGFDLRSITPVIVGGTLLAGGRGGVLGTALAVILLAMLANMLNFLNISSFYQWIAEGLIVIAAVSFFAGRKSS